MPLWYNRAYADAPARRRSLPRPPEGRPKMSKSKWPPEKIAGLLALVEEGLSRREIAGRMGVAVHAVTTKLYTLGLAVPLNPAGYQPPQACIDSAEDLLWLVRFPRFQDVTRAEAALISQGAPRSAPFTRTHNYSLTGNAGWMCAL